MARFLIFVGTRKALEKYDMLDNCAILYPGYPDEQNSKTLAAFDANPDGMLAVPASMDCGFHVHHDTFIVFDESWGWGKDHPKSHQARGRRRIAPNAFNMLG